MRYYFLIVSVIYLLSSIVFALTSYVLDTSSNSGNFIGLLLAGFFTAWHFVQREKRAPRPKEKQQLIWGSIASTFIVSLFLIIIVGVVVGELKNWLQLLKYVSIKYLLIGSLIVILFEFIIFYFSYGWYAKKCATKHIFKP